MAWKSVSGTIQKNTDSSNLRIIVDGVATEINSGSGGAVEFANITGDARDNDSLDSELDAVEALANEALNNIGELDELQTTQKNDVVAAVNELDNRISQSQTDNITLNIYKVSNYATL